METVDKFYKKYESIAQTAKYMVDGLDEGILPDEDLCAHLISEALHNAPARWTGLVSEKTEGMPLVKMTKEHFFSRKQSSRLLFEQIRKGKSIKRLTSIIMSRVRVHRVTKQENIDLIPFQHDNNYKTWQQEYKAAGINLVKYVRKNSYTYYVGDKKYDSSKQISDEYGISTAAVNHRCDTHTAKFSEWRRVKNG